MNQINPYKVRRFLDAESGVRVAYVNTTEAVQELQAIQNLGLISTMLVGRALSGAALLAAHREHETISVYFHGSGPVKTIFAEAQFEGGVRGYTPEPRLELDITPTGLDLKKALGEGHLTVVKTHPQRTQSQKGTVAIQTGQVGDDIAFYLLQSEQIRSAITVGVKITPEGSVLSAGGLLIELLPGADKNIEIIVEDQFVRMGALTEEIYRGRSGLDIVNDYLPAFRLEELEHPYDIHYSCRCSRNRLLQAMEIFKDDDLKDIIAKKENPQAKCEFCGRQYTLEWTEVSDVLNKRLHMN